MTSSERLSSIRASFRRALPTVASTLAGVAAGVVLVISCNMGPSISMADGTTGGDTSGGSTGGSAGGSSSGGSTGGGSGGSCNCNLSGPITLAGPVTVNGSVTNVSASENSAQLVSGQLPLLPMGAPGTFDCSSIAQNGAAKSMSATTSCIKLVDGPFVLTDLVSVPNGNFGVLATTWIFAAPPSANWDSSTQAEWFVAQAQANGGTTVATTGMHYVVPPGSSLYAVAGYVSPFQPTEFLPVSFSWSGFTPYK